MTVPRFNRRAVIGLVLLAVVLLAYGLGLLDSLELKTLDWRFRARGALPPRAPIVLISIDQDSFDEMDPNWPWPRSVHAELVGKLAAAKPALIGLDILLPASAKTEKEDEELAGVIGQAGNVILAGEFTEVETPIGKKTTMNLPAKSLRDRALGYGYANLITDGDGVVRRGRLEIQHQENTFRSFAYDVYRHVSRNEFSITSSRAPTLINYRGPAKTYEAIPYYRVLRGEVPVEIFKDKVILIGSYAPSLHDVFPTAFSPDVPMAGVEIQAHLLETLLLGDTISTVGGLKHLLVLMALSVLAYFTAVRPGPYLALVATAGAISAACAFNFYLFTGQHVALPFVPSFLAMAGIYGGITVDGYIREFQTRVQLRQKFGQYVSSEVVDEILENQNSLGLGGKRRHITVLFSDIRDFTKISEENDPETVVTLLSDYLAKVTQIVFDNGGTVDKFIGDAVMAIFGAPKSYGNDAERAVKTGVEILHLAASMESQWQQTIGRPLKVGVGINTGDAVVGSIGSEIRSDYTAIGDAVNTASRLEGMTKELKVPLLFSELTAAELKQGVAAKPAGTVQVIGRAAPLAVYTTEEFAPGAGFEDLTQVRTQQHK